MCNHPHVVTSGVMQFCNECLPRGARASVGARSWAAFGPGAAGAARPRHGREASARSAPQCPRNGASGPRSETTFASVAPAEIAGAAEDTGRRQRSATARDLGPDECQSGFDFEFHGRDVGNVPKVDRGRIVATRAGRRAEVGALPLGADRPCVGGGVIETEGGGPGDPAPVFGGGTAESCRIYDPHAIALNSRGGW